LTTCPQISRDHCGPALLPSLPRRCTCPEPRVAVGCGHQRHEREVSDNAERLVVRHVSRHAVDAHQVFKNALAFTIKSQLLETHIPGVKAVLEVLKLLYKVNKRVTPHKVPLDTFYVEEIADSHLTVDIPLWLSFYHHEDEQSTPVIFCRYPFLLSLHWKTLAFALIAGAWQRVHSQLPRVPDFFQYHGLEAPVLKLSLRPSHLLEDTFRQLSIVDHSAFRKALVVQFEDDKKMMDVNKSDLFLHVFDELMDPQSNLVVYNEGHTLAWFPAKPEATEKTYFLFGVLCGLALYNCNVVHLPFPLVFFKKLLGVKATLDDLKEFEPTVGESLRCILEDYSADDLKDMDTTFTVTWAGDKVELDPENTEKLVTASNKKEFVAAFVDHVFNKSVEGVFEVFKRGFLKVCIAEVLDWFLPEELQAVMVGNEEYDWDVFEQNTVYVGEYHAQHRNILTFWQVFHKLSQEEKKKFLLFLTGSKRVPVEGMARIRMKVGILPNSTDLHYPEALTCHDLLLLPLYPRYPMGRQMHNRLVQAINHSRGFSKTNTHQAE
ncbi:probable E3 ubiquitin-protein ligase HERC6, partial [Entelurus aequoreus]|uniref:probable E3 ubiquitin-protein ligase HERC6 n=1 Tax=Entelurus aequoreus TaxID=161455 RepID=UPI002B1E58F4